MNKLEGQNLSSSHLPGKQKFTGQKRKKKPDISRGRSFFAIQLQDPRHTFTYLALRPNVISLNDELVETIKTAATPHE